VRRAFETKDVVRAQKLPKRRALLVHDEAKLSARGIHPIIVLMRQYYFARLHVAERNDELSLADGRVGIAEGEVDFANTLIGLVVKVAHQLSAEPASGVDIPRNTREPFLPLDELFQI